MSTVISNRQVAPRPASKIPPPLPASAQAAGADQSHVWERWSVILTTAFGISLALHLILLLALAFWMLITPVDDMLSIESALDLNNKAPTVDLSEVNLRAAPAAKADVQQQRAEEVFDAAKDLRNEGPDTEIEIPDVAGGGGQAEKGDGADGKGFFGTGREANSFVFVVDCSDSMRDDRRFDRAVRELKRVIASLKPTQKYFVIFYNYETIPMFDRQTDFSAMIQRRVRPGRLRAPVRKKPQNKKYRLKSAVAQVKQRTNSWIRRIHPQGGTFPEVSLRIALSMKPEVVYFLTDGQIPGDTDLIIREANKSKVRVNTVALGYPFSAGILKRIAEENNGRFRFVK